MTESFSNLEGTTIRSAQHSRSAQNTQTSKHRKVSPLTSNNSPFIGSSITGISNNRDANFHSKAKKSNTLEVPDSTSSLNRKTRRLSERLKEIPVRPSKVLTNAVEYVNRRRNEIRQLNKYNRKLHCFFIFMILALVCLIQNWGGRLQYYALKEVFTLAEGSMQYEAWKQANQNITTNYYLFNVTNPDEILTGEKPKLVEIGPYEYKIIQKKLNVELRVNDGKNSSSEENESPSVFDHPTIGYQSELIYSNGQTDIENIAKTHKVTHINLPMMELKSKLGFLQKSKLYDLKDEKIFTTNTVYDWLWGFNQTDLQHLSANAKHLIGDNLGLLPTFGMMQNLKPGTILSENEVFQGKNAGGHPTWDKQLQLASYSRKLDANCWNDKLLDSFVNATEGLGVGPMILKDSDEMFVYRSEFCHRVGYKKSRQESKYLGLLDLKIMEPVVEETNRFCLHANSTGSGIYCGKEVYEIGKCKGASNPLAYSNPYFRDADDKFVRGFDVWDRNGEKMDRVKISEMGEEYGSRLGIEPTTGLTWIYVRRFQVNVGFNRLLRDTIPDFDYLHEDLIYLPVIWVEMKYELPAMMGGKPVALVSFIIRAVLPRLWLFFLIVSLVFLAIPTVQRYRKRRNHLKTSINSSNQDFDAVDASLLDLAGNRSTTL